MLVARYSWPYYTDKLVVECLSDSWCIYESSTSESLLNNFRCRAVLSIIFGCFCWIQRLAKDDDFSGDRGCGIKTSDARGRITLIESGLPADRQTGEFLGICWNVAGTSWCVLKVTLWGRCLLTYWLVDSLVAATVDQWSRIIQYFFLKFWTHHVTLLIS